MAQIALRNKRKLVSKLKIHWNPWNEFQWLGILWVKVRELKASQTARIQNLICVKLRQKCEKHLAWHDINPTLLCMCFLACSCPRLFLFLFYIFSIPNMSKTSKYKISWNFHFMDQIWSNRTYVTLTSKMLFSVTVLWDLWGPCHRRAGPGGGPGAADHQKRCSREAGIKSLPSPRNSLQKTFNFEAENKPCNKDEIR